MANPVPDRANARTKYYVTNGEVGTDNTRIYRHDLSSNQGRSAMRRAIRNHRDATGKHSWAENEQGKKINPYG